VLRRLPWVLKQRPDVLVVELGANDGLRGQPVAGIEANLRQVVTRARTAGSRVLLLGVRVPPSLGGDYARDFAAIYPRVAKDLDVPLVPFFLDGVAGHPELNQADGIHPNERGAQIVAHNVLPALQSLLRTAAPAVTR
jgi:acyl-CoA thioesterase-1